MHGCFNSKMGGPEREDTLHIKMGALKREDALDIKNGGSRKKGCTAHSNKKGGSKKKKPALQFKNHEGVAHKTSLKIMRGWPIKLAGGTAHAITQWGP